MGHVIRLIITALSAVRLAPHIAVLLLSSNQELIRGDLDRWAFMHGQDWERIYGFGRPKNMFERIIVFVHLMTWYKEYRNVFYLRTGKAGILVSILCRPLSSLYLNSTNIGPGLFIQHGDGTYVSAEAIGENCWINQQVGIGYINGVTGRPTIGNNVTIAVGAKVLGGVKVGDNAKIGANSVVTRDVPANATVMGVPAVVVWTQQPPQGPNNT